RRDVAPPAVVEAEQDEDRKLDHDDHGDHLPRQQVAVVDRRLLVERQEEGEAPGGDDQQRVEQELPEAAPADPERSHTRTSEAALWTTATTSACCSSVIPAHSGRQRFSREARSVSGR